MEAAGRTSTLLLTRADVGEHTLSQPKSSALTLPYGCSHRKEKAPVYVLQTQPP